MVFKKGNVLVSKGRKNFLPRADLGRRLQRRPISIFFFKKTNSSRDTGDPHPIAASAVARHSRLSSSPFLPTHAADALTPPPRLPLHRDYGLKVFFFCSTNESGRRKLDLAIPQPNLARRRPDPACDN